MDKTSISIGIMLLALFVFPIIYVLVQQRSKNTRSKQLLTQIASEKNINLDSIEIIGQLCLGLDSIQKKLVVLEHDDLDKAKTIDLKNIQKIRINKIEEYYVQKEVRKQRIVHLGLEFISAIAGQSCEITFYDEEDPDSTDVAISLNHAKNWDIILQKNIAY